MTLIDSSSLAATLNNLHQAILEGRMPPANQRQEVARWIASRVGVPGSYRGLPAPTGSDYHKKLRLFTGEIVASHAGAGCKLGFEATWALSLLKPKDKAAIEAADRCRERVLERFGQEVARRKGMYCCHSCSVAGWMALGQLAGGQSLLSAGLGTLRDLRDGKGRWQKYPFWYSLLALVHAGGDEAKAEIQYAAASLERFLHSKSKGDVIHLRRRVLAQRALGVC